MEELIISLLRNLGKWMGSNSGVGRLGSLNSKVKLRESFQAIWDLVDAEGSAKWRLCSINGLIILIRWFAQSSYLERHRERLLPIGADSRRLITSCSFLGQRRPVPTQRSCDCQYLSASRQLLGLIHDPEAHKHYDNFRLTVNLFQPHIACMMENFIDTLSA